MNRAKHICMGLEDKYWDDINVLVKPCANFILTRIIDKKSSINLKDPCALNKVSVYSKARD